MNKILLIGPLPKPTTGVSLANKVVLENLKENRGCQVDFINTSYSKFDENLGKFSFKKFLFFLKLNFFSHKVFKNDIIYITPGQTFFGVVKYALFIILSKFLGKELIIHVHGNYLGKEFHQLKGIKKIVFKWLLSKTTKGIVLSESLTGNMSPFIDEKQIFVLYNFVQDYLFSEDEKLLNNLIEQKPKIIFLSNLMEEKGVFDLLEALKILEEEGFEYEAKIAGNIDVKHEKRTKEYFSLLKNVTYCGVVSGNEKQALLTWGNIFILPTYYTMEGQPISILEAMATRNLVLTTNHAGIPDIFKENVNGFYVEKQNPNSIALKIKKVYQDFSNSELIRKQNFIIAKKKYRVDNFINNFIKIINE
ncbi:glycosyltransferase family 4 protein [Seonamhaeicola sp. NFXS20]|uniref:glycosyltransferase family 4 protein n=1 Tax=Seonamhaeicola sp. NFXS20 TaxID=2816959 RepID=UPI003B8E62C6